MKRFWFIGIIITFILVATGELTRLSIGPLNGILPNDVWVGILATSWILYRLFVVRKFPKSALIAPLVTFVAIALISLLNSARFLDLNEIAHSGLYLIRFIEYFFLTFITADLSKDPRTKKRLFNVMVASATVIAILGFIQLKWFPDFTELQDLGWDPHVNRLLSTWFDPNFVGGMFALMISLIAGQFLSEKKGPIKLKWAIIAGFLLIALFLTYSRSAYLAIMTAVGLIGLLKSRKLLVTALIASLLLISVSDRAQERVVDMVHSGVSMFFTTAELPDATARLRIESWQNAFTIIQDHPWIGVGYNTYAYVQSDYGFVKNLDQHSATGSDSTLLTILATTGILGFMAYTWLLVTIAWIALKRSKQDLIALGLFTGLCGLLIHAVFVNGLLYTPILIFFYSALGLILPPSPSRSH